MRAQRIVKGLDIGENIRLSSTAGVILAQVNQFTFETAEKVLRHSVVVRVTLAGHALPDAQRGRPVAEGRSIFVLYGLESMPTDFLARQ